MTDERPPAVRRREAAPVARAVAPLAVIAVLACVIWNGVFDLLVTRGVKEYLYRAAEHELGRGPAAAMDRIMGQTVADAVVTATWWALFAAACGWLAWRIGRQEARASCTR